MIKAIETTRTLLAKESPISQIIEYKGIPVKFENGKIMFRIFGTEWDKPHLHYYWTEIKREHLRSEVLKEFTERGFL